MSENEHRPEAGDPLTEPGMKAALAPNEFTELSEALIRLQGERRNGIVALVDGLARTAVHAVVDTEAIESGIQLYVQAQNDIERLIFLMLFRMQEPFPTLVMPAGTDEAQFFETLGRLQSGQGVVVPPGTKIGRRSALEVLSEMGEEQVAAPPDHPYVDAATYPLMPKLDGLVTTIEGPFDVGGEPMELTFIEMGANKIQSSQVSAIGCIVARNEGVIRECIFVRFKGGALYRYWPFRGRSPFIWTQIVTICRQMSQALPVALTVGEYTERVLKAAHDQGQVICERLDNGKWVPALTKTELEAQKAREKEERERCTDKKCPKHGKPRITGYPCSMAQAAVAPFATYLPPTGPATPGEGTEGEDAGRPPDYPNL